MDKNSKSGLHVNCLMLICTQSYVGTGQSAQELFRLGVNMELIYRSEEVSDSLSPVIILYLLLKFTQ